jgi:two-component system, LytTR family, sensor kinase
LRNHFKLKYLFNQRPKSSASSITRSKIFLYIWCIKTQAKHIVILLHILFWSSYLGFTYFVSIHVFAFDEAIERLLITALLNAMVYIFCYSYLIPKYFKAEKQLKLLSFSILMIFISYFLRAYIENNFIHISEGITHKFITRSIMIKFSIIPQVVLVLAASLIGLIKLGLKKEQEFIALKMEESGRELLLIKSRINPHFLLNTLNNIYAINHDESPQTSKAVLQLSQVLTYTIYKGNQGLISLGDELEMLQALIGLYQLKYNNQLNIQLTENIDNSSHMVPSLVMFSLVENAFKHSNVSFTEDGFLSIQIELKNKKLHFEISNSFESTGTNKNNMYQGGLGKNALYAILNKYSDHGYCLDYKTHRNVYTAILSING